MEGEIKLGSLFSGSGGFELAGSLSGITPVWNSEIEPFPILVTTKRFPKVKHLGDVSSINGAEYKMWGNGIALPNALFVMQGIAEELKEQEKK